MIDLSIIIPHKNSPKLLERLLKSIPQRLNSQIIVVDNNSSKEVVEEVVELTKKYSFELHFNNIGIGAGAARNTGLQHAVGDWILFADADDFFMDSLYENVMKYLHSDYDIIFFNINSCYSDTLEPAYRDEHIKSITTKYMETGNEGHLRYKYLAPWGKLFKRTLLIDNSICFEEVRSGDDMMFSILSGLAAKKIHYDQTPVYMITLSEGTTTTTITQDRFDAMFMAALRTNKVLRENKQGKFQASVLYFIAKSYQFGFSYMLRVFKMCIKYRANIFVGIGKLLNYKKVLSRREGFSKKR